MSVHKDAKRITTQVLHEMKQSGERIAMLTAYDFSMTRLVDQAGIDIILVGDSASNVMAGHETTAANYPRPNDLPCLFGRARGKESFGRCGFAVWDVPREF